MDTGLPAHSDDEDDDEDIEGRSEAFDDDAMEVRVLRVQSGSRLGQAIGTGEIGRAKSGGQRRA